MKKRILSLALLLSLILAIFPNIAHAEPSDIISFTDPKFEEAVRDSIGKPTGPVTQADVAGITSLYLAFSGISNLSGIEYFTALTLLSCNNNKLTQLDVSRNAALEIFSCEDNQLTNLDVSKNAALTVFHCYNNKLTQLDVSKNTVLKNLDCSDNQLTQLDVSNNTVMEYLDCSENKLTQLDVGKNFALRSLNCNNNQMTELKVSGNTALEYLYCNNNQLAELDVSNKTALSTLDCRNNNLPGKTAITGLDEVRTTAIFYPQRVPFPSFDTAAGWALPEIYSALNKGFVPEEIQDNYANVITRQEFCRMAVMFVTYAAGRNIDYILEEEGLSRDPNAFSDTTDPYILAAFALGITYGTKAPTETDPGRFEPNGQFNRQEAATMLMRVCKVIGKDADEPPVSDFVDLKTAADWAYDGINYVYANGIMRGTSTAAPTFNPKGTYTRQESIVTFDRIA